MAAVESDGLSWSGGGHGGVADDAVAAVLFGAGLVEEGELVEEVGVEAEAHFDSDLALFAFVEPLVHDLVVVPLEVAQELDGLVQTQAEEFFDLLGLFTLDLFDAFNGVDLESFLGKGC